MTNRRCFFLNFLRLVLLLAGAALLAACEGVAHAYYNGLTEVSHDGRWIIVDEPVDVSESQISLVDRSTGVTIALRDTGYLPPVAEFSPDDRLVLFKDENDIWRLSTVGMDQSMQVATAEETARFLPNGKLLVVTSVDGLQQFYVVAPDSPEHRSLRLSRVQYSFPGRFQRLLEQAKLMASLNSAIPARCVYPTSAAADRGAWLLVDAARTVFVLDATDQGVTLREIDADLSSKLLALLSAQLATMVPVDRQTIAEDVKRAAAEKNETLTDQDLAARVEASVVAKRIEFLGETVFVRFSPDATKLTILLTTAAQTSSESDLPSIPGHYDLYLIDLASTDEPLSLASGTEWLPSASFSPDSRYVIFESNRDRGRHLYLANADGSNIRLIADDNTLGACWF